MTEDNNNLIDDDDWGSLFEDEDNETPAGSIKEQEMETADERGDDAGHPEATGYEATDDEATSTEIEATLEAIRAIVTLSQPPDSDDDPKNAARQAIQTAETAIYDARPPFALRFIGPAVFRDRTLLAMGTELTAAVAPLSGLMARSGAGVLHIMKAPGAEDLSALARTMQHAATRGQEATLRSLSTPSLRCSPHPAARAGGDPRQLDPELQAAELLLSAQKTLTQIYANPGMWPWSRAVSMLQQLERAAQLQPTAAQRASELDPSPWTPARIAISQGLQCLLVLGNLRVHTSVRRAATHTLIALSSGLERGQPADPLETARSLLPRMTRPWSQDGQGEAAPPQLSLHQLRVCALVQTFADTEQSAALTGVTRLIYLLLSLASDRLQPTASGRTPTILDLLAAAASDTVRGFDIPWIAALVATHRQLPVGSGVQLHDGRFAVVLDPGQSGDPWRPIVQAGDKISVPDRPVTPTATP